MTNTATPLLGMYVKYENSYQKIQPGSPIQERSLFHVTGKGCILYSSFIICDALRDLVPFVQFKKTLKTPIEECYI